MGYSHLTQEERFVIHELLRDGRSFREIARILRRSPSTIAREVKRNKGKQGYECEQAGKFAKDRRRKASSLPRKSAE